MEKTKTAIVREPITDEGRADINAAIAELSCKLDAKKKERKLFLRGSTTVIRELAIQLDNLFRTRENGYIERTVPVSETINPVTGIITTRRLDTGAVIDQQPVPPDGIQLDIETGPPFELDPEEIENMNQVERFVDPPIPVQTDVHEFYTEDDTTVLTAVLTDNAGDVDYF